MGVVGLETSFAAVYTHLVKPGVITLEKAVDLFSNNARRRFGLPVGNDFTVWDLNTSYTVDPAEFLSQGRATPFTGTELFGRCVMTVHGGNVVYLDEEAFS